MKSLFRKVVVTVLLLLVLLAILEVELMGKLVEWIGDNLSFASQHRDATGTFQPFLSQHNIRTERNKLLDVPNLD